MTVADEAKIYVNALFDWTKETGGTAVVVSNLKDLWEQAVIASDKTRVLICFAGEQARGSFSRAAATRRVDRQWQAAVTRGRGYASTRGNTLTDTVGNADSFYSVVEQVRDKIRALNNVSVEAPLDYKSTKPMSMGQLVVDGYLLEWSTAQDLAQLTTT